MGGSAQTGPRGGRYIVTASGKRVYLKAGVEPKEKRADQAPDSAKRVLQARREELGGAKSVLAARIDQRAKQRVLKEESTAAQPMHPYRGNQPSPSDKPMTDVQKRIQALRVRWQVAEENRVFNADKVKAANTAVAQAAKDHPVIRGWDENSNAAIELHAHRVGAYAADRRWSVTHWRDQKVETFKTPQEAAERFVSVIGHEAANKAVHKASMRQIAEQKIRDAAMANPKPRGLLGKLGSWLEKKGIG